jgi:hypothetical protein
LTSHTAQLQPIVDKTAQKLHIWKAHLMNKADRKSVLSAIPIHQLLVLISPKKIIKLLEKIQKGFLWSGTTAATVTWIGARVPSHLSSQ